MQNGHVPIDNSTEPPPPKIKSRTTMWSSDPSPGYLSRWIQIRILKRYLHPHVHLGTVPRARMWKWPKCTSGDEWMKTVWSTLITEYYTAFKEKDILWYVNTKEPWGHHADGNSSVTERQHCMLPLTWDTWNSWIHKIKKQNRGCRGLEGECKWEITNHQA